MEILSFDDEQGQDAEARLETWGVAIRNGRERHRVDLAQERPRGAD
jgi:hypothetical protein